MLSLALRNARIVTPKGVIEGDLGIENGQITHVGQVGPAQQDVDLVGHWLMPGGVDPHAHIEQMSGMGLLNADTFETATRSALMGGTTSVISFAAQRHGESIARRVADYSTRAARGAMTDYAFHLIVSDPHVPDFASELRALIEAGHRSLKLFTTYLIKLDDPDILMVMGKARDHGALTCVHAENDALIGLAKRRLLAEGKRLPKHHAESHPRLAEIEAVERLCHFAEYLGSQVMLFHISTAEAAETVRAANMRGVPIWAETCPHYLMMTEEILDQPDGGKWMCSPPQRTAQDQAALWAALADGTLDLVSSDHAPFRYDETGKLAAGPGAGFPEIANGMPGLETRLPLMFNAMVT
ncbi:MAG: amidohydrolase family protein, partial [Pseudomonadota bacterium]